MPSPPPSLRSWRRCPRARLPAMTTEAKPRIKITYATLRNDNEELHALYDAGVKE